MKGLALLLGIVVLCAAPTRSLAQSARPGPSAEPGPSAQPGPSGQEAARPPAEGYALHCAGCHGLDGNGHAGVVPSLRGLARLAEAAGGRAYVARVPGVAQAPVGDAELAALLNWVAARFSDAPLREPYSPAELGAWRRDPLRDARWARPAFASE